MPRPYEDLVASGRIQRFYLDELNLQQPSGSLGLGIIQLIVEPETQASKRVRQLFQQVQHTVANASSQQRIIELIEKVLVYKFPHKSYQELEAMFTLTDWEQTQFYKDVEKKSKLAGKLETKLETVPRLLKLGLTVEQIAEVLELEIEAVRKLAR